MADFLDFHIVGIDVLDTSVLLSFVDDVDVGEYWSKNGRGHGELGYASNFLEPKIELRLGIF